MDDDAAMARARAETWPPVRFDLILVPSVVDNGVQ